MQISDIMHGGTLIAATLKYAYGITYNATLIERGGNRNTNGCFFRFIFTGDAGISL